MTPMLFVLFVRLCSATAPLDCGSVSAAGFFSTIATCEVGLRANADNAPAGMQIKQICLRSSYKQSVA